jgi:hypothetical protein
MAKRDGNLSKPQKLWVYSRIQSLDSGIGFWTYSGVWTTLSSAVSKGLRQNPIVGFWNWILDFGWVDTPFICSETAVCRGASLDHVGGG